MVQRGSWRQRSITYGVIGKWPLLPSLKVFSAITSLQLERVSGREESMHHFVHLICKAHFPVGRIYCGDF